MKIWLLTSETPLFNPGGIARYVDNFARQLAGRGHEVLVFGRDDQPRDLWLAKGYRYCAVVPRWGRVPENRPATAAEHPAYPYNIMDYWSAFSFQMAEAVLAEIRLAGPPDVIESQEYCALPYYLLQRKWLGEPVLANIPLVVNAHSPDFIIREENEEVRYQFPHYWTGRQELFCLHAADARICPSRYLASQLEERFGGSIDVHPFPLPWTPPRPEHLDTAAVEGKVVYFGRLEVRKGVLELVRACDRLWQGGARFTLHLIGADTDYRPRGCRVGEWLQRRYATHMEAGRLVIPGPMEHEALMGEMASAAVTVIPSRWENWPNTCIEAMAHGKVVVASTNGGQAEMIGEDDACGFLFRHGEENALESALERALALSPERRREMGGIAQKRIATLCSPEVVVPAREAHFSALKTRSGTLFPFVNRHLRQAWMRKQRAPEEVSGRVSVIVPHYNLGAYLGAAVDSALASDWPDLEVVLVDDGSDEGHSRQVVDELEARGDRRIRILRQENRGLAAARNAAVAAATGECILLLDADDAVSPEFVRRAMGILGRFDNVHIVYSWEQYLEASNDVYPCWNFEFPYLLGHNMTCPISVLYRQSYLRCGGSDPAMTYNFEDYELWIRMVAAGCGGVAIPEPLSYYRIRENSMWQDSPRTQHLHLQEWIARKHADLFREYGPDLFGLQNANGSAQKWIKPAANSPFDTYEEWSRRRISTLEKEAEKWWKQSVEGEQRLREAQERTEALWREKNALLERESDSPAGHGMTGS